MYPISTPNPLKQIVKNTLSKAHYSIIMHLGHLDHQNKLIRGHINISGNIGLQSNNSETLLVIGPTNANFYFCF